MNKRLQSQYIFLIGGFILAIALLPTVFGEGKPAWTTSALTGGVLGLYTLSFIAQHQRLSAVGLGANTLLWVVLLVQAL